MFSIINTPLRNKKYGLGEDVTDIIGITKYESEPDNSTPQPEWMKNPIVKKLLKYKIFRTILLPKKEYKGFPKFISKTDEENVQNLPYLFSGSFSGSNDNITFVVREKLEGQSGTWFLKRKKNWFGKEIFEFGVCSRNVRKFKKDNSSYWYVAQRYNIENVLKTLIQDEEWVAIQGECVGPGIQDNIYKLKEIDLYVFNYLRPGRTIHCDIGQLVMTALGLKWCPKISDNFSIGNKTANDILEYSNGESLLYDTDREGLVFRNYELGISFKARSPRYLLNSDT